MQGLTDKYRPRTIEAFIGIEKPKKIMEHFSKNPFMSSWLFTGKSGTGKTSMAMAVADAIGAELHHIPSQKCTAAMVEETIRKCHYRPLLGIWHLVLVEEADKMTQAAQLQFLSLLDATAFPPMTIFVFTSNATDGLEDRFLSRCRTIEFSNYGLNGTGSKYLETIWDAEYSAPDGKLFEDARPDFARILKDSKNNLRDALMSLEMELMVA